MYLGSLTVGVASNWIKYETFIIDMLYIAKKGYHMSLQDYVKTMVFKMGDLGSIQQEEFIGSILN